MIAQRGKSELDGWPTDTVVAIDSWMWWEAKSELVDGALLLLVAFLLV